MRLKFKKIELVTYGQRLLKYIQIVNFVKLNIFQIVISKKKYIYIYIYFKSDI